VRTANIGHRRRWIALVNLRLASAILRGATALYGRGAIPGRIMRAALSTARFFELAGGWLALGRRPKAGREVTGREKINGDVD